jgi:hypothetical protein
MYFMCSWIEGAHSMGHTFSNFSEF